MSSLGQKDWKWFEKLALLSAVFVTVALIVPYHASFYERLSFFSRRGVPLESFIGYLPWFANNDADRNFWPILSVIAVCIGLGGLTYFLFSQRINYPKVYVLFRIAVRYKLAGVMFWYGIQKAFPIQMPFPTLSQLNSKIGDVTPAKLYWLTTGSSASYQIFCGVIELLACVLLLWRRTVTLGALLMAVVMVQVFALNVFYDAGVQLKSFAILLLSLFLLASERHTLFNFFMGSGHQELNRSADHLALTSRSQRQLRVFLKTAFIAVFFVWRGYQTADGYLQGKTYKLPTERGLPGVYGIYNVEEFWLNGQLLPYSPVDSNRWQNVVFEKWNTLSIAVPRPIVLNTENRFRTTEFFSNAGREFYSYEVDTATRLMHLERMGNPRQQLSLTYVLRDSTVIIAGVTNQKDTLRATLKQLPKQYPLIEGKGEFIAY